MEALKFLPACPRLSDLDTTKPDSLKDWLELICLSEYFDVFYHNGFNSMERLHMLWEVELTSVSYWLTLTQCSLRIARYWYRVQLKSCMLPLKRVPNPNVYHYWADVPLAEAFFRFCGSALHTMSPGCKSVSV